jgi:hypothetical protein
LRGWRGNPWGFETSIRHHRNDEMEYGREIVHLRLGVYGRAFLGPGHCRYSAVRDYLPFITT